MGCCACGATLAEVLLVIGSDFIQEGQALGKYAKLLKRKVFIIIRRKPLKPPKRKCAINKEKNY